MEEEETGPALDLTPKPVTVPRFQKPHETNIEPGPVLNCSQANLSSYNTSYVDAFVIGSWKLTSPTSRKASFLRSA